MSRNNGGQATSPKQGAMRRHLRNGEPVSADTTTTVALRRCTSTTRSYFKTLHPLQLRCANPLVDSLRLLPTAPAPSASVRWCLPVTYHN